MLFSPLFLIMGKADFSTLILENSQIIWLIFFFPQKNLSKVVILHLKFKPTCLPLITL